MTTRPLLASLFLCAAWSQAADLPTSAPTAKWHPGHYAFVQSSPLSEEQIYKNFRGVQKTYTWRTLEPEKDHYDFTAIRSPRIRLSSRHSG